MKSLTPLIALPLFAAVSSFTVSSVPPAVPATSSSSRPRRAERAAASPSSRLFSDRKDEQEQEEDGLDLDLGEMFTMFEAADNDEDFDDAIKKVKEEEQ